MVDSFSVTRPELEMRTLLDEVSRELVRVDVAEHGEGIVALPSVYPGGAPVVVHVRREGEAFVVTDQGNGYLAAELLGGVRAYSHVAPGIAQLYGVRYDGDMMFAAEVTRPWLANAIIFTGSASRKAVERTAEKMAEERDVNYRDALRERVQAAFPTQSSFDVSLVGQSTREWHFAAQVLLDQRRAVFDIVTPHPNSVAAAYIKFQDVAKLPAGVDGIAVASRKLAAADQVLISQAAHSVIPLDASVETFRRAA
jgi:hypothetical protein